MKMSSQRGVCVWGGGGGVAQPLRPFSFTPVHGHLLNSTRQNGQFLNSIQRNKDPLSRLQSIPIGNFNLQADENVSDISSHDARTLLGDCPVQGPLVLGVSGYHRRRADGKQPPLIADDGDESHFRRRPSSSW